MRKHVLPAIANFLKDSNFITFAFFWAIFYFAQLYTKLGYMGASIIFGEGTIISYLSGISFGCLASSANASLVLNNKDNNRYMINLLIFFDVTISIFFYSDALLLAWSKGEKVGSAIASLLMGIYAPTLIYFLAERFRKDNLAKDEAEARAKEDRACVEVLLANLGITSFDTTAPVATLLELVANKYKSLASDSEVLANEASTLRPLQAMVADLQNALEAQSKDFKSARDLLADNQENLRVEREKSQILQEKLSEVEGELQGIKNGGSLKTEKGNLTKFIKAGDKDKAEAKVIEIESKFGVSLEIDWTKKEYREVA